MDEESLDGLSEVLCNLQQIHEDQTVNGRPRLPLADQLGLLRGVLTQMQVQLDLHGRQVTHLRQVIALLSEVGE